MDCSEVNGKNVCSLVERETRIGQTTHIPYCHQSRVFKRDWHAYSELTGYEVEESQVIESSVSQLVPDGFGLSG
jgi:hypothetical protein